MASSSQGEDANPGRSSSGGAEGVQLKKGPWTAAEDAMLIEYVNKNGEGNWNAVLRNSGLQRCGKSCRLRWANHLRPNLKKGAFTAEEERLILELHAKYGNKWARMASQMPGRTDNEIKNYWNTRMKRHQRAGLAIYPSDIQSGQLHHQSHRQHRLPRHRKHHHHPALKSTSPTQMLDFQNQRTLSFNPPISQPQPFLFTHRQFNFFTEQSNADPPQSYQPSLFSPILSNPLPPPLHLKQELDSSAGIGSSEFGFLHFLNSDMPSLQSTTRATSSATTTLASDHFTDRLFNGSSGMLDDVLNAVQFGRTGTEEEKDSDKLLQPLKKVKAAPAGDEGCTGTAPVTLKHCGVTTPENSSSGLTSIGMRMEEPVVDINPLDDELTSLLDSFPSASPTPQWYRRASINDSSSDAHGGVVLDLTAHPLPSPAADAARNGNMDQVLSLGGSSSTLLHNPTTMY